MAEAAPEPAEAGDATAGDPRLSGGWRRWRRWAAVALLVVVVGAAALSIRSQPSGIALARQILDDDQSFATPVDAGVALTRISVALQDAGEGCGDSITDRASTGTSGDGCSHLFSAAAYARVAAVEVLPCTRRGVAEARKALQSYLDSLESDPATSAPPLPACADARQGRFDGRNNPRVVAGIS